MNQFPSISLVNEVDLKSFPYFTKINYLRSSYSLMLLFTLGFNHTLCSQSLPVIEWQKSLGGDLLDNAQTVRQTSDGGYAVAGNTRSVNGDVTGNHGGSDLWLLKLSSAGDMEWQKCLGGSLDDFCNSFLLTNDGGYILIGETASNDGDVSGNHGGESDFWVVKLDSAVNIEWQKCFGGSGEDEARCIQQIDDGYIVSGLTSSNDSDVTGNHGFYDAWVIKLDNEGNMEWNKCLGGSQDESAYFIEKTIDGGYILTGATYSNDGDVTGNHGNEDYWIVKLSPLGIIEWQKCFGGSANDIGFCIQQTNEGGYVVAGAASSINGDVIGNHGDYDYWILKLDNGGNIEWQKCFGGSGTQGDWARFIRQTLSGGYIITGYSGSEDGDVTGNHGYYDHWLVKLDNTGNLEWQKSFGGSKDDYGRWIIQNNNGGYVMAGNSFSDDGDVSGHHNGNHADFWIAKLLCPSFIYYADADSDGYGNINESKIIDDCSSMFSGYVPDSTDCDDDNPDTYPGAVEIFANGIDDDCDGYTDEFGVGINEPESSKTIFISPNPAADHFIILLSTNTKEDGNVLITVTDVLGKKMMQLECSLTNGELKEEILIDNKLPRGIYLIQAVVEVKEWKALLMVR